jgi:hypothetical protein
MIPIAGHSRLIPIAMIARQADYSGRNNDEFLAMLSRSRL